MEPLHQTLARKLHKATVALLTSRAAALINAEDDGRDAAVQADFCCALFQRVFGEDFDREKFLCSLDLQEDEIEWKLGRAMTKLLEEEENETT